MSGAFINVAVGGLFTVAGTTTLSGALTSASTLNSQGITTSGLNVNGNATITGTTNVQAISTAQLLTTTGLQVNGNATITGNTTTTGLRVNGNTITGNIITGNLTVGNITNTQSATFLGTVEIDGPIFTPTDVITNQSLSFLKGVSSYLQPQLNKISVNSLQSVSTGIKNLALGDFNLPAVIKGSYNTGVGIDTLSQLVTGSNNIAIGKFAGGGVLNDNNISIGVNTGAVGNYTGSTCIGLNAFISASDQIVLGTNINKTKINGDIDISGSLLVLGNLKTGASTITNTSLGYLSGATSNIQTQFTNNTTQFTNITTQFTTNTAKLNGINGNINTLQNNTTNIQYNGTATTITGITRHGGILALVDSPLYLREYTDPNHTLVYNATSDGPALKGTSGGRLGTVVKGDIMTWNSIAGVHSTTVNGDNYVVGKSTTTGAIIEVITGRYINFYRKLNCATTETFNFQSFHGKYEVFYNANHDQASTAFLYVDVCNNVNGGSFITIVNQGSGVGSSINTATNVFTITNTVTGATLIINRLMAY